MRPYDRLALLSPLGLLRVGSTSALAPQGNWARLARLDPLATVSLGVLPGPIRTPPFLRFCL
jgi:hypothetical protein